MRDPFTKPFCRPQDLGLAIPENEHAVSVCLPRWQDVIGYEEGEESVVDAMDCGYPRFVIHPTVAELFLAAQEEFAKKENESAFVFPSLAAAWRCADYVKKFTQTSCRLESYGWENLSVLLVPEEHWDLAWKYWQHSGEIVGSRLAQCALTDAPLPPEVHATAATARRSLQETISSQYPGTRPEDVFLFSSGMGAISAVHRALCSRAERLPTIQVEFPYIDTFKIQEKLCAGRIVDFSHTQSGGAEEVNKWFADGNAAAALYTEVPSNPLLRTANCEAIQTILQDHECPFVIDDSVVGGLNAESFRFADVVTTSLTKSLSGEGNVMGGAALLHPDSPYYDFLREQLGDAAEANPLFELDVIAADANSAHFEERTAGYNANAEAVVDFLEDHPLVKRIWYPRNSTVANYEQVRRSSGGYGGLFSFTLTDRTKSPQFYDALEISKGPSFGTNFSLVCPYTLLAHYQELDWAAERGVPAELIRCWAGLEEPDDLVDRFESALECCS